MRKISLQFTIVYNATQFPKLQFKILFYQEEKKKLLLPNNSATNRMKYTIVFKLKITPSLII